MGKIYYVASPYTHVDENIREKRFKDAQIASIHLIVHHRIWAFSPIAYNHPMVIEDIPTDWDFWEDCDKSFLDHCDAVIVLTIPGWEESLGVIDELKYARELGIPSFYISLDEIKDSVNGLVTRNLKALIEYDRI